MRSSILGASTMLNVLIQHLPLQSLFWTKIWRAFRASDPSTGESTQRAHLVHTRWVLYDVAQNGDQGFIFDKVEKFDLIGPFLEMENI